jgi:(p)ppGpp synthase/HD superfamily hydrolase
MYAIKRRSSMTEVRKTGNQHTRESALNKKLELSRIISMTAHEAVGQKRNYTNEPYWIHPRDVAELVKNAGGSVYAQCAAWLHDTEEDTKLTNAFISSQVGKRVAKIVSGLTDVELPVGDGGSRYIRKALTRIRIECSRDIDVMTVKLADVLHNGQSIFIYDRGFSSVFWIETLLLLEVLVDANEYLYLKVVEMLNDHRSSINRSDEWVENKIAKYREAEEAVRVIYDTLTQLSIED